MPPRDLRSLRLRPALAVRRLWAALGILLLLHLFVAFGHLVLHWRLGALTQLVDLDLEANLPTFYNAALFFIGAALFLLHGANAAAGRRGWFTMAGVFFFLGIDEGSQIHEKFMYFTMRLLENGQGAEGLGWFYYAWVIPYGLAGFLLVSVLARWIIGLDPVLRRRLVISGAVYVCGAVLLEMAAGKVANSLPPQDASLFPWLPCEVYGDPNGCWLYMEPRYILLYTLEETGEMAGLILCIRALLEAFEAQRRVVSLSVDHLEEGSSS